MGRIGNRSFQIIVVFLYMVLLYSGHHAEAKVIEGKHQALFTTIEAKEDRVFKDIKVDKNEEKYMVTGKVKLGQHPYYYTLEDGHDELVSETIIPIDSLSSTKWRLFKIEFAIPTNKWPENGEVFLILYEKDEIGNVYTDSQVVIQVCPNNKTS